MTVYDSYETKSIRTQHIHYNSVKIITKNFESLWATISKNTFYIFEKLFWLKRAASFRSHHRTPAENCYTIEHTVRNAHVLCTISFSSCLALNCF